MQRASITARSGLGDKRKSQTERDGDVPDIKPTTLLSFCVPNSPPGFYHSKNSLCSEMVQVCILCSDLLLFKFWWTNESFKVMEVDFNPQTLRPTHNQSRSAGPGTSGASALL